MSESLPDFQRTQIAFAASIRDPEGTAPPVDVSCQRMTAYRDLFFSNIENFIATAFPVSKSVLGEEAWRALIRDFYRQHRCRTPLFIEIAAEFLDYLSSERSEVVDPPFLFELAHYEWLELALAVSEEDPPGVGEGFGASIPDANVSLSPVAWPVAYRFPVHHLGPNYKPSAPDGALTFLVVYRNQEDQVRFMELNQVSYGLLQSLGDSPGLTVRKQLLRIAQELQHPAPDKVLEFGVDLIRNLYRKGIVRLFG
jgi:hypothetical protein